MQRKIHIHAQILQGFSFQASPWKSEALTQCRPYAQPCCFKIHLFILYIYIYVHPHSKATNVVVRRIGKSSNQFHRGLYN
jgi:hypothetical protein